MIKKDHTKTDLKKNIKKKEKGHVEPFSGKAGRVQ